MGSNFTCAFNVSEYQAKRISLSPPNQSVQPTKVYDFRCLAMALERYHMNHEAHTRQESERKRHEQRQELRI